MDFVSHAKNKIITILIFATLFCWKNCYCEEVWSNNSVTLLYGTDYKLPLDTNIDDKKRYIITLSHASKNSWGNLFSFLDIVQSVGNGHPNTLYGEFSPRFSILPIFSQTNKNNLSNIKVSDVFVATALEYGSAANGFQQQNHLIGAGVNLDVPFLKYLNLNFYRRFNQRWNNDYQASIVWGVPIELGKYTIIFDGWADYVTPSSGRPFNLHLQSQLKIDAGKILFNKKETLYLGTEYRYWHNKFGILGIKESLPQILAQIYF